MGRTKPNPLEKERERKLQRIAQRFDCCDVVMTYLFTVRPSLKDYLKLAPGGF